MTAAPTQRTPDVALPRAGHPNAALRYSQRVAGPGYAQTSRRGDGLLIVAEFLFIAFLVGLLTKTWLGFLGTFLGLYALYRFTRLSALLSLALSAYWGLLGYHLGAATGEVGVGPLLAALGFAIGAWVHRGGFLGVRATADPIAPPPVERAPEHQTAEERAVRSFPDTSDAEIIDADYRVVS